jgi:hypothetical protein
MAKRKLLMSTSASTDESSHIPHSRKLPLAVAVLSLALVAAGSLAQAATTGKAHEGKKVAHVHSTVSLKCSEEANAKGLHGAARKAFRRHCIYEHTAHAGKAKHHALAHPHKKHMAKATSGKKLIKSPGPKAKTEKTT